MQAAEPRKGTKINNLDKKYFREIFNLHADKISGKITYEKLQEIFIMVDFKPNDKQDEEFKAMFHKTDEINFNDFLNIFSLKSNNQYNKTDVLNAFRLLSKEYERPGWIRIDRVREILAEMGLEDVEIIQLTSQLEARCDGDENGMFNFEEFVESAF